MKRGRPRLFLAKHRFLVEVLFLHGLSASRISRFLHGYGVPMTTAQVKAQLESMGCRKSSMTLADRQARLDRLRDAPLADLPEPVYRAN